MLALFAGLIGIANAQSGQIFGYVSDSDGNPIVGVRIYANNGNGGNNTNATDGNGYYLFNVGDGNWDVGVDCGNLSSLGYQCTDDQSISISDDYIEVDFTVQQCGPPQITTTSLCNGMVGSTYSNQLQAYDCQTINWSLTPGSLPLPSGLTLSPANGTIAGNPQFSGDFTFSVRATDISNFSSDQELSLIVLPSGRPYFKTNSFVMKGDGSFHFQVGGPSNYVYFIETSSNLTDWTMFQSTNVLTSTFEISDSGASTSAARFYRVAIGSEILDSTNQIIYAAQGGTITLGSGSSAVIPPGFLTNDAVANLSLLSSPHFLSPNGIISSQGDALALDLSPLNTLSPQVKGGQFVKPQLPGNNSNIALYLAATSPAGTVPFSIIFPTSTQQPGSSQQSLFSALQPQSDGSFIFQPSFLQALGFIRRSTTILGFRAGLNLPICDNTAPMPLFWDGSKWTNDFTLFDPTKRTLVFVHGMISSVETAFPNPNSILEAGGYCQALGFDYDWTLGVNDNGLLLAASLNKLLQAGMPSVDIEAHSEGVAVSLSAAHYTSMPITNMVLLGGPIQGTQAANFGYTFATLLGFYPTPSSLCTFGHSLADIENGQFLPDLAYHSQTMSNITTHFANQRKNTRVIEVAGTNPTLTGTGSLSQKLNTIIFGSALNDGIIPKDSAEGLTGMAITPAKNDFFLVHTQLEEDPAVISFVGMKIGLSNNPPVLALNTNQFDIGPCNPSSSIDVSNASPGCAILQYFIVYDPTKLTVDPDSGGVLSGGAVQTVNIAVNTNYMEPGEVYNGGFTVVNISNPANTESVNITYAMPLESIVLNTNQLAFVGCEPTNLNLVVSNSGPSCSTLNYSITSDQPWLSVSSPNGVLGSLGMKTHSVSVNPANINAGTHIAKLTITDLDNSVLTTNVSVSLETPQAYINIQSIWTETAASEYIEVAPTNHGQNIITTNQGTMSTQASDNYQDPSRNASASSQSSTTLTTSSNSITITGNTSSLITENRNSQDVSLFRVDATPVAFSIIQFELTCRSQVNITATLNADTPPFPDNYPYYQTYSDFYLVNVSQGNTTVVTAEHSTWPIVVWSEWLEPGNYSFSASCATDMVNFGYPGSYSDNASFNVNLQLGPAP